MFASPTGTVHKLKEEPWTSPALVLPMPSLKSARQRAKFENLSEGQKHKLLSEAVNKSYMAWVRQRGNALSVRLEGMIAFAVLAVMEGRTL